ncbi:MAG: ABC transporter permease [Kiritimatiellae bacterium]|nr:ABC transporter permease [Kiritimatiellia bacterium]
MANPTENTGPAAESWRRKTGLVKWRGLALILVARNLKIRYKGSALGFFWSLLTPALTILMYAVFAHILKFNSGRPEYLQFLVTGLIAWGFTAGTLNDSLFSIAGNANLVKKVKFPRAILPLSTALANGVNFCLTLVPLVLYLAVTGSLRPAGFAWLVPAALFQFLLCAGIALLVGTLNVFFRDVQHAVGIGQLAWFFLTPVFYDLPMQLGAAPMHGAWKGLVFLNPMTGVLALWRRGLMGMPFVPEEWAGTVSPWWVALSCASCAAVFAVGAAALRSGDGKFGDVL